MAKGVRPDGRHIQAYKTPQGAERFRVRLQVRGKRVSGVFATINEAIDWRDARLKERRDGAEVDEQPRRRTGRNLVTFVRDEYWPAQVSKLADRTRRNYGNHFRNWVADSELGRKAPELIDSEDITEWQEWCRGNGASEEQIRTAQKVISGAYRWAARLPRRTGIQGNPIGGAEWPSSSRVITPYIAEPLILERVRREILASSARGRTRVRAALLLSLMAQTGMRPGEARMLQLQDVSLSDEVIDLPAEKTKTKEKNRAIPLFTPLAEDIEAFKKMAKLKRSSYLIFGRDRDQPMSFTGWERWRRDFYVPARDKVAKRLGDQQLGKARAYDLCRHSYAAQQIAALMPLNELAETMGHSVDVLSKVYAAPLVSVKRKRTRGDYEPIDPEQEIIEARAKTEGELSGAES